MRRTIKVGLLLAVIMGSFAFATLKVDAVREPETYIVAQLDWLRIFHDGDLSDIGELEIATVVVTRSGKQQTSGWPRKAQDSSWQEMDARPLAGVVDFIEVDQPIFALKESEIGGEMAVVVVVMENDERPGWVKEVINFLLDVSSAAATIYKDPHLKGTIALIQVIRELWKKILPEEQLLATHAKIIQASEWDSGYLGVTDELPYCDLAYNIRRIEVPVRTPPLAVRVNKINGTDWGSKGPLNLGKFIHTRVYDSLSMPSALVQMNEFETGDLENGEVWDIDGDIFSTDAVGPFLYVEIGVWDKEPIGNNRVLGLYSGTFWPAGNWGIGRSYTKKFNWAWGNTLWGDIEIEFEIVELPFSDVEVTTLSTGENEIIPGNTRLCFMEVANLGTIEEDFEFTVEGLNPSWYILPSTLTIPPGYSSLPSVQVTPPEHWSTTLGKYEFTVTATTASSVSDSDSAVITVLSFRDVEVVMPPDTRTVKAGQATTYTINVKNVGNVPASYRISLECLDFDEAWATLWPDTLWDLQPGETRNGFLQICVPKEWQEGSTYSFTATATDTTNVDVEQSVTTMFSTTPLELGEGGIAIELCEGLDYLYKEDVKIRISALVTDAVALQPISGASGRMSIYYPNGTIWMSGLMTEVLGTGIYEWQSNETIREMMKHTWTPTLVKGVYLVHVAISHNGYFGYDIIELHIDPPAEETSIPALSLFALSLGATLVAVTILVLKKKQSFISTSETT